MLRPVLALGSGLTSLVAQATFTSTVGLGSVVVAMLVVILFGIFSLRDKRNAGWKDLYEQEREKNTNLIEEKEVERTERHAVKDDLATTKALLAIEKAKPDLSVILERQQEMWTDTTAGMAALLKTMQETQEQMLALLTEATRGAAS